jgi:hypothetical protein
MRIVITLQRPQPDAIRFSSREEFAARARLAAATHVRAAMKRRDAFLAQTDMPDNPAGPRGYLDQK